MSAQQRADETESTLREQQAQHEAHVAVLEARLAELSESVGSVERLRQQDQQTIQKLRERLVQVMWVSCKLWWRRVSGVFMLCDTLVLLFTSRYFQTVFVYVYR